MLVFLKASGRQLTNRWIHTSRTNSEAKMPVNRGRVYRKRLTEAKILASFLKTNYFQYTKPSPLVSRYESLLDQNMWKELECSIQSGLQPNRAPITVNHMEIIVPAPGSYYFQNYLVRKLAVKAKADLFVLDVFDLTKLKQLILQGRSSVESLYSLKSIERRTKEEASSTKQDTAKVYRKEEDMSEDEEESEDEIRQGDDSDDESSDEDDGYETVEEEKINVCFKGRNHRISLDDLGKEKNDTVNAFLDSVSTKCKALFKQLLFLNATSKVIHLRDSSMMEDTFTQLILKPLVTATEELRQEGHGLVLVVTHSENTPIKHRFSPAFKNMSSTLLLPFGNDWETVMKSDETKRIAEINTKGWITMSAQKSILNIKVPSYQSAFANSVKELPGISETLWPLQELEQRSAMVIGRAIENQKNALDFLDFEAVNDMFLDSLKKVLLGTEKTFYKHDMVDLETLKETCNSYERRLLKSVTDPKKLQGSFKDICVKPSTIETLYSLVSLPLTYPDFFSRGILKKNFIPGVLLFGPSGTGKTLLAKAVAKESGSIMLDIKASDVYDMYVGQGEKNVRAIFSLARKISPCVIFIDEVDSLMGQRGSDYSSKSHREIVNQFMIEWDGLSTKNQGILVMAATNRPFDLDPGVLRRMPQRILLDLPNEQDRLKILKILLKEQEHKVDLVKLSKSTQNYSGSDLKNMCVTAALKAIQEHIKSGGTETVILTENHFEESLKIVLPSLSEETGILAEIKKWDSQFGNGRKERKSSFGFS
ncbi:P-loop containing nucleoside triphosphate hydrolase protein [Sporodiniella umbellata]|nr:P-loop containing nucleoside triphosphate hydrolase protein [Sporodiniella umbellata]